MNKVSMKLALITGASSGLGECYARIHAQRGGDLILVARRKERLEALKEELEAKYKITAHLFPKDLSQINAAEELFAEISAAGLRPGILINNAGLGGQGDFIERSMQDDMNLISVDLISLTKLTKLFLPAMLESHMGRILNVSSTASLIPGPGQATYFAVKAYVTSFSEALWEELRGTGVTTTALLPGGMKTGFSEAAKLEGTSLGAQLTQSADAVALKSYDAMLQGKRRLIAGVTPLQRIMIALMPIFPKALLLSQTYKLHKR